MSEARQSELTDDERLRLTVKHINTETVIRIDGVGPESNELIGDYKVAAYPNPTDGRLTSQA